LLRAVLDANVLVSAIIRPENPPGRIVRLLVERAAFELVMSPSILEELRRSLGYPRVRKYLKVSAEELDSWLWSIVFRCDVVEPTVRETVVEADPDDDIYLFAAADGRADYLVSGDRHLLDLKKFQEIRIVTARVFLSLFAD
jgi:putative PIN family toxin of toxin-antitoxin system